VGLHRPPPPVREGPTGTPPAAAFASLGSLPKETGTMRFCGHLIGLLALVLFLLPGLTAQEEKKEKDKAAEKKEAKKDEEKKDPEKPEKPEKPEPEKKPAEEKFVYGTKVGPVKLLKVEEGEMDIEVQVPDPAKLLALQQWSAQQMYNIAQQKNPQQYAQQMANYQIQLAQKQANETTSPKTVSVKAAEGMKVRLMFPPLQFDDQGNIKRYTAKQLAALRGKSKWPGYYPGETDMLKAGQVVDVYISKASMPAPVKTKGPRKKGDLEAEVAAAPNKPEAVLIVVIQEAYPK